MLQHASLLDLIAGVSFMIRLFLWVLGRGNLEVKCHCPHITSRVYVINVTITVDVDLDHLGKVVFVRLTFFPFLSGVYSLERSHLAQLTLLEGRVSTYIIWNSSTWENSLISNLVIQSFIYINMDLQILYNFSQSYCIYFAQIVLALASFGILVSL